jgi:DNA-binding transcriptional regulator YdaS (Cro superfamily)
MSRRLSKKEAIALFSSAKELAKALGISKSAVSQWPDGPIPDNHDLRIRYELKPEHFRPGTVEVPARTDGKQQQQRDI